MTTPLRPDATRRPDLPRPYAQPRPRPSARHDPALWIVGVLAVVSLFAAGAIVARPASPVAVGPPPGVQTPTPTPSATSTFPTDPNGTYSFIDTTYVDGSLAAVRWNPCRPIEYAVNLEVSPPGARAAIHDALAAATTATGIAFRDDGSTTVTGHDLYDHGFFSNALRSVYRPVLITVVSHPEFLTYKAPKHVIAFTHPERGTGLFGHQYVAGLIVVDGGIPYPSSGRWSLTLVIQHEVGHLMGLDHVKAGDELMFSYEVARSTIPDPIDGWGPGDLTGLELVGADQGCLRTVRVAA